MKTLFLIFTLVLSTNLFAITEDDFKWEIASQNDDIIVYRAEKHESGIVPIKGQTIFKYSMSQILSLIADTPKKIDWVPYLLEGRLIKKDGPFKRVEYAKYKSPWPFQDRVFVINISGDYDEAKKEVYIELKSIDDPEIPYSDDVVRGMTYYGAVRIRYIEPSKTFFEIVLLSDFKGNVPHWIVNMVQRKWPYKMFTQMREQLSKPDFQVNPEYDIDRILKERHKKKK